MEKQKRKHGDPRPNPFMLVLSFIWTIVKAISSGVAWGFQQIFKGIQWGLSLGAGGAWYGIQQVGYGLWWLAKQPYRIIRYILNGRIPNFETVREEEIFWRIKRKFRRQRLFLLNTLAYLAWIVFGTSIALMSYQNWQSAIARADEFVRFYQTSFYNDVSVVTSVLGVWTLILIGHFIFNKMGNSEDMAMKEAFDEEYSRADYHQPEQIQALQHPPIDRLVDNTYPENDPYFDGQDAKPKRNGARI